MYFYECVCVCVSEYTYKRKNKVKRIIDCIALLRVYTLFPPFHDSYPCHPARQTASPPSIRAVKTTAFICFFFFFARPCPRGVASRQKAFSFTTASGPKTICLLASPSRTTFFRYDAMSAQKPLVVCYADV